jgi:hypothetical protein
MNAPVTIEMPAENQRADVGEQNNGVQEKVGTVHRSPARRPRGLVVRQLKRLDQLEDGTDGN